MAARNPRDLFLHELSDIYDGEQQIVNVLPRLADEATDERVGRAFREHEQHTRQHIRNLERCFEILGTSPQEVSCAGLKGIREERDSFRKESNASKELLTLFDLGAGEKVEHYEIASYKGLVDMAHLMGELECGRLLHENLAQEEWMAAEVARLSHELGREAFEGMGGAGGRAAAD